MRTIPCPTPGEILLEEFLKPMQITQYRLAKEIGVPQRRIGEILAGKRSVTADTGLRLSRFFGTSEGFWTGLQDDHDRAVAKDVLARTLAKIKPLDTRRVALIDEPVESAMDTARFQSYWWKLESKEKTARVGKIDAWKMETLQACFDIYEHVESIANHAAPRLSIEGMQVIAGGTRSGHGRNTVIRYSRFSRNRDGKVDPACAFSVYRLDGGEAMPYMDGKTGIYLSENFDWERGINIVVDGADSDLAMFSKMLKLEPPANFAYAGSVESSHRPRRFFFEGRARYALDLVTVHLHSWNRIQLGPTLCSTFPLFVSGQAEQPNEALEVRDKYSGDVAARVALADAKTIDAAIAAAVAAEAPMRAFAPYARQAVLEHCIARFRERFDELAMALCVEAGKPIKDSEGEVTRLIDTFKVAAEEAVRIDGEIVNLEISKRADGYRGFVQRVPIGACSFITPFNFPLNLVAHKVAPAIAAGCPFVLKPSEKTPIGALIIGEILAETDLPKGAFSILPCRIEDADPFVSDDRLKLLSFTGGQIGWDLKAKAGRKKVVLELGGNAACIVDADQRDKLDHVIDRLIFGAYYQSGQSCIKVQRVFVHASIYDELRERFVAATKALKAGDPKLRDTFLGPVIDEASAKRLETWIGEATAAGARLLCGGARKGNFLEASVLENVPHDAKLNRLEAFGPVTVFAKFDAFDDALAQVNDSDYGLQAGVFTDSLTHAMRAWDALEVGGVVVNDIPSFRVDNMPYGGVKRSGLGREGIRYAIEDMTERRLLVMRDA